MCYGLYSGDPPTTSTMNHGHSQIQPLWLVRCPVLGLMFWGLHLPRGGTSMQCKEGRRFALLSFMFFVLGGAAALNAALHHACLEPSEWAETQPVGSKPSLPWLGRSGVLSQPWDRKVPKTSWNCNLILLPLLVLLSFEV